MSRHCAFDRNAPRVELWDAMLPGLPAFAASHWLVLALKTLAALGFIWSANLVILYAC